MEYLQSIHRVIETQASSIAIQGPETRLSYAELGLVISQIKHELKQAGVAEKSYVGLYVDDKVLAIASIVAILDYGCAYIPLDPIYPADRLAYMLENAAADYLLCDTECEFAGTTQAIDIRHLSQTTETLPKHKHSKASIDPASPAYLIYTSGSTGKPKGVIMPQGVLNNLILWQNNHYPNEYRPKTLQFSSLSFDVSFQEIISTLSLGGTLYTLSPELKQDFKSLAEFIVKHSIERLFMPYVALKNLMQWFVRLNLTPSSLKEVITAGEQLIITDDIRQIFTQLKDTSLSNQYGPSESHVVSEYILQGEVTNWPEIPPIGQAIDQASLLILDEQLAEVNNGEVGELFIGGPVLASGYINNPDETGKRFIALGEGAQATRFYRTGDLVYQDKQGNLHYSGRMDNQVKLSGYRIELSEIEAVLMKHKDIDNAAVGVLEKNGQKSLIAFMESTNPQPANSACVACWRGGWWNVVSVVSACFTADGMLTAT